MCSGQAFVLASDRSHKSRVFLGLGIGMVNLSSRSPFHVCARP